MQKVLIFVALLGVISAFPIEQDPEQDSLNNIYNNYITVVEQFVKNINHECVQTKLNLQKNGNKIVRGEQGLSWLTVAAYLCSDELTQPRVEEKLSKLRQVMIPLGIQVRKCLKIGLWKMEPNSPLLDDFDKNVAADDISSCEKSKDFKGFSELTNRMKSFANQLFGEDIGKCKNDESEKKRIFELLALVYESRPDVKAAELKKYIEAERTYQDAFFHCIMKPIEDKVVMNSIDGDGDDEQD